MNEIVAPRPHHVTIRLSLSSMHTEKDLCNGFDQRLSVWTMSEKDSAERELLLLPLRPREPSVVDPKLLLFGHGAKRGGREKSE